MADEVDTFLARIDKFVETLGVEEQEMFRLLVDDVDDDDVVGLGVGPPWPGVASLLSPIKLDSLRLVGGPISSGDLGSGRIVDT